MATEKSEMQKLTVRIERLEKQNRKLRRTAICTIFAVVIAGGIVLGYELLNSPSHAKENQRRVVEADEFIVRGPNNTYATLASGKYGPSLSFFDSNGKSCASFGLDRIIISNLLTGKIDIEVHPSLKINDNEKQAHINISAKEGISINKFKANIISSSIRLNLGLWGDKNDPTISLHNHDFKTNNPSSLMMYINKNGEYITIQHNDKIRARFGVDNLNGGSSMMLLDDQGKLRLNLGCAESIDKRDGTSIKYPESSIFLFNKDNKVIWSAP